MIARPSAASLWFRSYIQTCLERDVRAISDIRDLSTFRRFLSLVATRCGNFGKRLVKSPKLHFVDSGLACHLLNITTAVSRYDVTNLVVHRGGSDDPALAAIRPGVKAVSVDRFLAAMTAPAPRRTQRSR